MSGLPGASCSKTKNCRQKAQKAQAPKTFGVAIFRGHSVCPRDEGFQSDKMTHVRRGFGTGQKGTNLRNAVKVGQTESNRLLTDKITGKLCK